MENIDYVALSKSRYTDQFDYDPAFNAIVQTLIEYKMRVQGLYINFADTILDIDKSTGKNLDLIGSIVGQERVLVDYYANPFFGFEGNPKAEPFDKGMWYSLFSDSGGDSRILSDEEYRRVIKARIIRNKTNCTRKDFTEIMYLLLGYSGEGSRNYVVNSQEEKIGKPEYILYQNSKLLNKAYSSGEVTISFDVKVLGGDGSINVSSSNGNIDWQFSVDVDGATSTYQRKFFTVTPKKVLGNNFGVSKLEFLASPKGSKRKIFIKNIKVEVGSKPTSWSPAPEDLFKLDSKSHGNIELTLHREFSSDFITYFLSKVDDLDSLIPKPLGYRLSVNIAKDEKSIVDQSVVVEGKYVSEEDGSFKDDDTQILYPYIPIKGGSKYRWETSSGVVSYTHRAYYDADKKFLFGDSWDTGEEYIAPEEAKFVSVSYAYNLSNSGDLLIYLK